MKYRRISSILLSAVLLMAGAASAQVRYAQVPNVSGGYRTELQGYLLPKQPFATSSTEQCLTRKSSGQTECHTYAEWERIAKHLKSEANRP